jgi:DNA-binding transcriptional LysR family regulator
MDRIEAMKVFVAALDEGSLAGAGRRLGRSAAAVSRAIAFLERNARTELLHRTTRCRSTCTKLRDRSTAAARASPEYILTYIRPRRHN